MNILAVGSIALDYLETPFGIREQALGGACTFITLAASFYSSDIRLVGVVGGDFPDEHIAFLKEKGIDLAGLERIPDGKTFSWGGKYHEDMNSRDTLYTELGVFEHFNPVIPTPWRQSEIVVLGNIHPALQSKVLDQMEKPRLVLCDTMNLWINITLPELTATIARVDILTINDEEAYLLSRESSLVKAGKAVLGMGPSTVIVKKGSNGSMVFHGDEMFIAPAYPTPIVVDPTGAGDAFAGGFAGYLAKTGDLSWDNIKRAVINGSAVASYCVEKFSVDALRDLSAKDIEGRVREMQRMTAFTLPS